MQSAIDFKALHIDAAAQFKESVSEPEPNTKIYLCYGKCEPWANDSEPDIANSSVTTGYQIWHNMIGGKRVTGNDIRHVIPRHNWKANTVYTAYSDRDHNLFDPNVKFYVLTSENHVYKCLSNASSSNSTYEPSSVSPLTVTETADGYIWKYMYSIDDSEMRKFGSESYIPVKTLETDDGSSQWDVQQAAVDGGIYSIVLTNNGTGYANADNIEVTILGDGIAAAAVANINAISQTVTNIYITNPGSGYRANAYVIIRDISDPPGTNAFAYPVLSPPGGHGSDPLHELGGSNLMINMKINASEGNTFPTHNDYRQVSLIKDPVLRSTGTVSSNAAILQASQITTAGVGDYLEDEMIYQGAGPGLAYFKGKVLHYEDSVVWVTNVIGTPTSGTLIGRNSTTARAVSSYVPGEFIPFTGHILYLNNFEPIKRAEDQAEQFQIILEF